MTASRGCSFNIASQSRLGMSFSQFHKVFMGKGSRIASEWSVIKGSLRQTKWRSLLLGSVLWSHSSPHPIIPYFMMFTTVSFVKEIKFNRSNNITVKLVITNKIKLNAAGHYFFCVPLIRRFSNYFRINYALLFSHSFHLLRSVAPSQKGVRCHIISRCCFFFFRSKLKIYTAV